MSSNALGSSLVGCTVLVRTVHGLPLPLTVEWRKRCSRLTHSAGEEPVPVLRGTVRSVDDHLNVALEHVTVESVIRRAANEIVLQESANRLSSVKNTKRTKLDEMGVTPSMLIRGNNVLYIEPL